MDLPVDYRTLDFRKGEVRAVREEYIRRQEGKCMYCGQPLVGPPAEKVATKSITWSLFPPDFRKWPIHLQHCHYTGMTEGAVHMRCNAVMWEYDGR